MKENRSAGIGYGSKYDFTKQQKKSPAPDEYKIKSNFELQQEKHRGFPFGVSRDSMSSTGILGNLNKYTPGPGAYESTNTLSKVSFSFRPKTNSVEQSKAKLAPGPGAYDVNPSINENGK